MTVAAGVANLAMSLVYLCYGTMTLFDLHDGWRDPVRRRFGLGFLAIMFTCGPHHLDHGMHLLVTDLRGGPLDVVVVAVGLPTGLVWFGLRLEALLGGEGDRLIRGTPWWLRVLPFAGAAYLLAMVNATARLAAGTTFDVAIVPNLAIAVLYVAIGGTLAATQFRNHDRSGRWSASGLSLSGVFLTGALMHLVYAGYALEGRYEADTHILPIDVLAVAGASYFLWLVLDVHAGGIHRPASRPSPTVTPA